MSHALQFITLEQLRALKAAGLIVVHDQPTISMVKAGLSTGEWPEDRGVLNEFHRMVAESIRLQNLEASEWRAFNAALDAVVIELPEGESLSKRMTCFQQEGAPKLICVDDCRAAIEQTGLGLKVLP